MLKELTIQESALFENQQTFPDQRKSKELTYMFNKYLADNKENIDPTYA